MKLGIQILNFNGMRWLPGLLDSLSLPSDVEQIIYIVDNGSTDESLNWLETEHPDVRIIRHGENLGYAEAYNRSIPVAFDDGCDWVCLQNTDTIVTAGWLVPVKAASTDPRIGILGPVFTEWQSEEPNYYMNGRCPDIIPDMFDAESPPVDRDWVEGSSLFIRRECYEQTGGMDPLYFMYWEEADLCRRARFHDWRVVVVPGSVCKHFAGGSGAGSGPGLLQLRNHFVYRLTDPFHSFLRNLVAAARLSLTYTKQAVQDLPNATRGILLIRAIWSATLCLRHCCVSRRKVTLARTNSVSPGLPRMKTSMPASTSVRQSVQPKNEATGVSVVIPVFNRPDLLREVLSGLAQQTFAVESMEILVCDDGSTEDLTPVVKDFNNTLPRLTHLRQKNQGPAAARNQGIRNATQEIVLFLDSDVLPDPSLVERLVKGLESNSDWTGAEASVVPVEGEPNVLWDAPVCENGGVYLTAAIAYRTSVLRLVGGMDENFRRAACEDVELAARVLPHGPIGFVSEASVAHPRRRKSLQMFWKKRQDWRYVLYLAQRHGFIGWPENKSENPRARLVWCALVTQPAGRFLQGAKLAMSQPRSGALAITHAVFSWFCGLAAIPDILTSNCPAAADYVGSPSSAADSLRNAA